ncbi:MAG TPA: BON domain-containing protein [Candidatus Limnocylindrales bacterium]|nr:BON domain-containing protein [Candidatus Limnocylindrales bacterium]
MPPEVDRPEVPPEQVDLVQDMPVLDRSGRRLGLLDEARCPGPEHIAQWLVVRRRLRERRVLGNPRIRGGRGSALLTDLAASDWSGLPPALDDADLRALIEAALAPEGDPAQSPLRTLTITVEAQRVFVQGYLRTAEQVQAVEGRLRAIAGVLDLRTRIMTDAELEAAVRRALEHDPRVSRQAIGVRAALGRIDLLGEVSTAAAAQAADRIAAGVPGVLAVHAYLAVSAPRAAASR